VIQECCLVRRIRDEKPCNRCHEDCGQSLNQEQEPPIGELGMSVYNAIGERACKSGCQRGCRGEDATSKSDLAAQVEEREEVNDPGPVRSEP